MELFYDQDKNIIGSNIITLEIFIQALDQDMIQKYSEEHGIWAPKILNALTNFALDSLISTSSELKDICIDCSLTLLKEESFYCAIREIQESKEIIRDILLRILSKLKRSSYFEDLFANASLREICRKKGYRKALNYLYSTPRFNKINSLMEPWKSELNSDINLNPENRYKSIFIC